MARSSPSVGAMLPLALPFPEGRSAPPPPDPASHAAVTAVARLPVPPFRPADKPAAADTDACAFAASEARPRSPGMFENSELTEGESGPADSDGESGPPGEPRLELVPPRAVVVPPEAPAGSL